VDLRLYFIRSNVLKILDQFLSLSQGQKTFSGIECEITLDSCHKVL